VTGPANRRRAGLFVPLFSCPSTTSWGIGDIGDLPALTAWIADAGGRVLQLLPLNEMAPGLQSPYSALSAMAVDPLYVDLRAVPEFAAVGGEASFAPADRQRLADVRRAPGVEYATIRRLKHRALSAAFEHFRQAEWCRDTGRARELKDFAARQAWWLEDYSLFRAIHLHEGERPWPEWPEPLRRREPAAIDRTRRELSRDVLYFQYVQWLADTQWQTARQAAHLRGVALFGDLPFMVDGDSSDVWVRQHQFRLDASIGVPPDAFSASGQDWGLPVYQWDRVAADDFRWLRDRARRSADLYDGYRIDHLVGFYRTYARPRDGSPPFFTPAEEAEQVAQGERILEILRAPGAEVIAEDLGTVPDFVRESLARLAIPGLRVFRWERLWHTEGQPFRDPADYPAASEATTGTHDTETLAVWWELASEDERRMVSGLPTIQRLSGGTDLSGAPYQDAVRDLLLQALFESGSDLVIFPVQDVFGWRDRINEPALVADANWTFRLPWAADRLADAPGASERRAKLREWAEASRRLQPGIIRVDT
jgi:4-alpha-glucanotransferase